MKMASLQLSSNLPIVRTSKVNNSRGRIIRRPTCRMLDQHGFDTNEPTYKTIIEPFRIKMVEPINTKLTRSNRLAILKKVNIM